jgi:hypothetical protein
MKIYLGAGSDRKAGFLHVDMYPFDGIDIVADVTKGLPTIETSSVDEIYTQDFMEHIVPEAKVTVINEIWRMLKDGGTMEHYIPNAGSRNDFGSPSHLSHWNLQQFEHFDIDSYRYKLDHVYEGFVGQFKKVLAEEVNWQEEYGVKIPQSIHVIYKAVK